LRRRWEELTLNPPANLPLLLTQAQERLVWSGIMENSAHGAGLLDRRAAARLAVQAHGLGLAYRLPLLGAAYQVNEDTEAFASWRKEFLQRCQRESWIPASALSDEIATHRRLSGAVQLAGFDHLTPQQETFLSTARVLRWETPPMEGRQEARLFNDAQLERTAVARWACGIHEEHPGASIAILAFDLGSQRSAWEDAFSRHCAGIYEIVAAEPLARQPLIISALALLELVASEVSTASAGAVLLSPYVIGHSAERFARAAMDEKLRRGGGPTLPLRRMAKHDICPDFHSLLQRWIATRDRLPAEQRPSGWASEFHGLLRHFGWPGDRRLNTVEFPVYSAWRDLLAELASLDRVLGAVTAWRALRLVQDLARETPYAPPPKSVPVHLIPATEPPCVPYDHVWLAGTHDGVFPPPVSANPFLPLAMQREYALPNLTPKEILRKSQKWAAGWIASTANFVVSAATLERKEPRRLSALFENLPVSPASASAAEWDPPEWEELVDFVAPPAATEAQGGGVRLFEFQAKCPFRAFAEFRLGARELEEPTFGFDKRKKGTALHAALHEFWRHVGSSGELAALSQEDVEALLAQAVDKVLAEEWRAETVIRERMREVERARLTGILRKWINLERQRPPFRVLTQEEKVEVELGGLVVRIRADRVDATSSGLILIDYKTTAPYISSWEKERILEPQLPLYAITSPEHVTAAAFAQVGPGKQFFRGVAESKQLLKMTKHVDLTGQTKARWREALEGMAREYREGVARVDSGNCSFCKLQTLCRKFELGRAEQGEEHGG
jgi:probable DNA repair protein